MRISNEERQAQRAPRWAWAPNVPCGFIVYLMVVDHDVKKAGKAENTSSSTFKRRMESEFRTARQVICGPLPRRPLPKWRLKPYDPFKKHAPPALLADCTVELWAKALPTKQAMKDEEDRLKIKYRGEWTQEGWWKDGRRRWADGEAD